MIEDQIEDYAGHCPHCGKQYTVDERYEQNDSSLLVPHHRYQRRKCPGVGEEYSNDIYKTLWKDMDTEIVSSVGTESGKCSVCQRQKELLVWFNDGEVGYDGGEYGSICEKCLVHLQCVLKEGTP